MSLQAMTWALGRETGSPSAKVVLLTLANYADARGCAFPSHKRLAGETEQSEDVIAKRLSELARAGLIYRTRRYSTGEKGGRRTNEYVVLHDETARNYARSLGWEELACADASDDREAADAAGEDEDADAALAPVDNAGLTRESRVNPGEVNPRFAPPLTRAVAGYHIELEPKPKNITPPPPKGGAGRASRFDLEFVPLWPFDAVDLAEGARRVFLKLSDDDQALAVRHARGYLEACRAKGLGKHLSAENWLRRKGWTAFLPKAGELAQACVFIERGSPQWMAWQAWYAANEPSALRKGELVAMQSRHSGKWGRTMRGEWPPAAGSGAARDGP